MYLKHSWVIPSFIFAIFKNKSKTYSLRNKESNLYF